MDPRAEARAFVKEQRNYQKYHNTPVEVDGIWFVSLADYEAYYEWNANRQVIVKKNIDHSELVKSLKKDDAFPPLGRK
jgi:hypothetical protein